MKRTQKYFLVLGGVDNEMEEIKKILVRRQVPYFQPQTEWGDIVVHQDQIPNFENQKKQLFVFVECRPAPDFPAQYRIIDHHNNLNHKPASLLQICRLFSIKPTINQQIIASIDANFLKETIKKFTRRKKLIIKLWRSGYRKRFQSDAEWKEFNKFCKSLWKKAKQNPPFANKTAVVWSAPRSTTLLSALADLEGWSSVIICGSPATDYPVPVLYQGDREIVRLLSLLELSGSYFGRGYYGCRAIPKDFLSNLDFLIKTSSVHK